MGYLAAILKRYTIFFRIMILYSAYIYGANVIAKFRWKSGFLQLGPQEPPLGTNGNKGTLVT